MPNFAHCLTFVSKGKNERTKRKRKKKEMRGEFTKLDEGSINGTLVNVTLFVSRYLNCTKFDYNLRGCGDLRVQWLDDHHHPSLLFLSSLF